MKKQYLFTLATIILTGIIVFCSVQTVMAQKKTFVLKDSAEVKAQEKEYVNQIKEVLTEEGIYNSGVMMTKVIYEDGARDYTVSIHNSLIQKLSPEERTILEEKLNKVSFPLPGCKVFHEFLVFD